MRFEFAVDFVLLRGDERVATTGFLLEAFAIEEADATSYKLNQSVVLELIGCLGDSRASCAEQVREQVLRDTQLARVHPIVDHQQQPCESCLRRVITMTGGELCALCE